ncbi:MAG: ABC transporter permease [Eubacteriales bacterium]|nr:ABC transporter permease [Eubacteriales bacterium]
MKWNWKAFLQGCAGIAAILLLWTVASATGIFGKLDGKTAQLLLPLPTTVAKEFAEMIASGYLLSNIWVSMQRVLVGFGLAVVIGLPLGILMGMSETLRNCIYPVVRFFSPIPGVAWVPLAILWFGLGNNAAIFIIVMGSLSPIIINSLQGVLNVDRKLYDVMRMMEASRWQIIVHCIVPSIIPYIVSGFKLGLGFAWRVVIAAELVGVPRGLGYVLSVGRSTANTSVTLITIISLGVIMMLMEEVLFRILEQRTSKWKKWE